MQTIIINKIEEGIKPPTGNGFEVFVHAQFMSGTMYSPLYIIDTGLEISLPKHIIISIESLMGFQIDWSLLPDVSGIDLPKGRLLLRTHSSNAYKFQMEEKPIAKVWIVKRQVEKIRFMEKAPEGGRVIRGEGKIANSTETGSIESREQIPNTDTE